MNRLDAVIGMCKEFKRTGDMDDALQFILDAIEAGEIVEADVENDHARAWVILKEEFRRSK